MSCPPRFPLPAGAFLAPALIGALSAPRARFAEVEFVSLTGAGSLVGFSGYRPTGDASADADPAAPWNAGPRRKWRHRSIEGDFTNPGTPCPLYRYTFAGYAAVSDAGAVDVFATRSTYSFTWTGSACVQSAPDVAPVSQIDSASVSVSPAPGSGGSQTIGTATLTGLDVSAGYFTGAGIERLLVPDTEYAALARAGGAIVGAANEAFPLAIDLTTPSHVGALGFSATTVRALLTWRDLTPGQTYTAEVFCTRTPTEGDPVQFSEPHTFTATAPTQTTAYDLPIFSGHRTTIRYATRPA